MRNQIVFGANDILSRLSSRYIMVNLNVNHMTNALFITNDLAENDLRACIDVATLTNQDLRE